MNSLFQEEIRRRVSRALRHQLAILTLFVLGGCGIGLDAGAGRQPPPADAVELSVYMRDLSPLPHYFVILGEHQPDPEGPVSQRPTSIGCGRVGRDWELIVDQTDSRIDPAADFEHRVSGESFGDLDVLSVWLSVEADGTVVTGEGVPEWWQADIQRCQ